MRRPTSRFLKGNSNEVMSKLQDKREVVISSLYYDENSRASQGSDLCRASTSSAYTFSNDESVSSSGVDLSKPSTSKVAISKSTSNLDALSSGQKLSIKKTFSKVNTGEVSGVSRKDKALGILCERFIKTIKEVSKNGSQDIHLESVARQMNVEKRRIYDIVNVMEALEAMVKSNKSYYRWQGLDNLPSLTAFLKKQAIKDGLPERISKVEQEICHFKPLQHGGDRCGQDIVGKVMANESARNDSGFFDSSQENSVLSTTGNLQDVKPPQAPCKARILIERQPSRNGQNSLANLCRRFLMVLLCRPEDSQNVSLDVVSTLLIKHPETEGFEPPNRSRCRRLYDVANVLVAMKLIEKLPYCFGTKKIPYFIYIGPKPNDCTDVQTVAVNSAACQDIARNPSREGEECCKLITEKSDERLRMLDMEQKKSDSGFLASEQLRRQIESDKMLKESKIFDVENMFRPSVLPRTNEVILFKPAPKRPLIDVSNQQPAQVSSYGNEKLYRIRDPKETHAFQQVVMTQQSSVVASRNLMGMPDQSSALVIAPASIPTPTFNSPYSVRAILRNSNRGVQ